MSSEFLETMPAGDAVPSGISWWSLALNFVEDQQAQIRLWRHRRASAIARPEGALSVEEAEASLALAEDALECLDAARKMCCEKIRECLEAKMAESELCTPQTQMLAYADSSASFKAARKEMLEELAAEYRCFGWDDSRAERFAANLFAEIDSRSEKRAEVMRELAAGTASEVP